MVRKLPQKLIVSYVSIAVLAQTFSVFLYPGTSSSQLVPQLLGSYTLSEVPLPIQFPKAGVGFNIPANFIDRPKAAAATREHSTLLLMAQLPDITGRNVQNNQSFGRTSASGDNPLIAILLKDKHEAEWDLSAVSSAYEHDSPEYSYTNLGETFGLQGRRQVPPTFGRWHWNNIYRKENKGRLSTSIICDGMGTVPYPRCDHFFIHKNILIHMNYTERSLKSWESIEANFRNKLESWER